uniref:Fatty acyl-CoA reductase n=1 Tax=Agrotis segetum TaxID=47767 RepID=A0A068FRD8_AGRSE|nr:fatty acyl reductase [Agrotis segetum]
MNNMFRLRILINKDSVVLSKRMKINHVLGYSSMPENLTKATEYTTTYQPIADFYAGKSVFVTGGTGFLGKVYLEKLLYSCKKVDKVYLLVREKKGHNITKRIEDLFANPLFSRLKKTNPEYFKKVVPVSGDITLPNLGLTPKDEQTLIDKVSVVYHAAATVRFNEPLPVAMNINFEGTQKVLELSRRMKNIEAFLYISTAYTQTQRKVLMETVYPPPAKEEDIYKFIEEFGNDAKETEKYLCDHEKPNSYTFTKALAESYIAKNHGDVPAVIIRPSAVVSIKDEPLKSWLDNWFGLTFYFYTAAKGWNRFNLGNSNNSVDLIPVDYVSNFTIIAGARAKSKYNEVQVFNTTSSSVNPVTFGEAHKYFSEDIISRGKNDMPCPALIFVNSKAILNIGAFFCQTIPVHIADMWLKMTGKKPKFVKLAADFTELARMADYFTSKNWQFRADRMRELFDSLSPEDKRIFPCDPTQIDWSEYLRDYGKGVRKYLKPK